MTAGELIEELKRVAPVDATVVIDGAFEVLGVRMLETQPQRERVVELTSFEDDDDDLA